MLSLLVSSREGNVSFAWKHIRWYVKICFLTIIFAGLTSLLPVEKQNSRSTCFLYCKKMSKIIPFPLSAIFNLFIFSSTKTFFLKSNILSFQISKIVLKIKIILHHLHPCSCWLLPNILRTINSLDWSSSFMQFLNFAGIVCHVSTTKYRWNGCGNRLILPW